VFPVYKRLATTFGLAVLVSLLLVAVAAAQEETDTTFVDPTATGFENVELGELDYVAPFAVAQIGEGGDDEGSEGSSITIAKESNVQDSVLLDATPGPIHIGDQVTLAHGAAVVGPASIGEEGTCSPDETGKIPANCPSFVGFNAVVDGATIERDAMILHLARVAPGLTIPSGCKVLPGQYITSQEQVGAPPACNLPNTAPVTAADRAFMAGVIEVNTEFAVAYNELKAEDPSNVRGINFNPETTFNDRDLPRFAGVSTRDPSFRNRIVGDVRLADTKAAASAKMGNKISLRADEGDPIRVGTIRRTVSDGDAAPGMADRYTQHALESTQIVLGNNGKYGFHSLVHGGPAGYNPTRTGRNFTLGDFAVFFRSRADDNVTVGDKSLVQQAKLASGTTIAPCTVRVGAATSPVEWCDVPFPLPEERHDG
jgi:carbonic anhydrase/acetyltransferase-like protein (isoleucine patch superfamily)